jgi:hypothetical protein
MYLALVAGVLGSFTASALTYRKIFAHDLIFGALAVIYLFIFRVVLLIVHQVIYIQTQQFHYLLVIFLD